MTLKNLCSEVRNLISPDYFAYGFLIVWKEGKSWNWYHITMDEWEGIKENDDGFDDGFMFLIKSRRCMKMMKKILDADNKATIIISDELEPQTWTCKRLMEDIKCAYQDEGNSLAWFYESSCMGSN